MTKREIPFKFKLVSPVDFELIFPLKADKKIFQTIFNASKKKLEKEKGISFEEQEIEEFEVPNMYLNYIKSGMKKTVRDVEDQVLSASNGKITLQNIKLKNVKFQKDSIGSWDIIIFYIGTYIDRR